MVRQNPFRASGKVLRKLVPVATSWGTADSVIIELDLGHGIACNISTTSVPDNELKLYITNMTIVSRLLIIVVALVWMTGAQSAEVTVYKRAGCGCCVKWVEHLRQNGFSVQSHNVADLDGYKARSGISPRLASCHTAYVDGYVIEGHVPAQDIRRLLEQRPAAIGLAVPGMPIGSPGMEQGPRKDPYSVLLVHEDGKTTVFADH